ncbi:MAG: hypothetical protein NTY47_04145 [Candidatus Omnitrophica bacterium]|nr:hypothetical protein [Candidatus Omnitrophota bacterium]
MKLDFKGKKNILIIIGSAIVVIILLARFVFVELINRSIRIGREVKLAEANLKKGISLQKRKDIIVSDIKKYQPYLLGEVTEEQGVVEALLKEVERLVKDSGVSIINLSPQDKPEKKNDMTKYKADLRVESGLIQLYGLINKIQQDSLLIGIEKLSITPKDEDGNVVKAEFTISLDVP